MCSKVNHNATASTLGTCYHLYLAVQECFDMKAGDKLYIETYGDITHNKEIQIEVKQFTDPLTDSHDNLWKTLKNWMTPPFSPYEFSSLILNTTQEFGSNAKIAEFNSLTSQKRLDLLKAIYAKSHKSFINSGKNTKSSSLKTKELVLASSNRKLLNDILQKITIITNSPRLEELVPNISDKYLQAIPEHQKRMVLDSLLGFVIKPTKDHDTWEITKKDFLEYLQKITNELRISELSFPRIRLPNADELPSIATEKLFIKKIKDIKYDEVFLDAYNEYMYACRIIQDELTNHAASQSAHENYFEEVEVDLRVNYRKACRDSITDENCIAKSQDFYDERILDRSPEYNGYTSSPPKKFRNGVLHLLLEDEKKELKWKLKSKQ